MGAARQMTLQLAHIGIKAHREHAVSFVEDQDFQPFE
jgi:hypothetical protein